MNCSPFWQADFTASAVLQAIRGELPQLHGLRLAYAANLACEKSGIDAHPVSKILDGFGKFGSPFVIRYIVRDQIKHVGYISRTNGRYELPFWMVEARFYTCKRKHFLKVAFSFRPFL